jgi:sugar/nucleoside kinase (ribokinase family)
MVGSYDPLAMLVCTLGDLTLDVVVRLGASIAAGGDVDSEIRVGPGGQAANAATWAAALGVDARFVGRTGADDAGALARTRLAELEVEVVGPVDGRNGTICSLVSPSGERSMASDRGTATELRAEDLEPDWLACDHFHVSGYALMREPVRHAALRAVELARAHDARVSVDLSSWSAIRDSGLDAFREAVRATAPDVVFANEEEERLVGRALVEASWILKRGARGCSFDGDEREALPVDEAVDSTGAGDALAAGWIVGGPDLALEAAASCVRHLGAMPIRSAA